MTPNDKLIPLRIRLPYRSEGEFIERYGPNVARGGVFIATRALKPEGTSLAFEFVLADGTRLLRGEGLVVRAQEEQGGQRAGMTVRFVRLDAASKAFIDRLLAQRGGQPAPQPPQVPQAPRAVPPVPRAVLPPLGEAPPAEPRPATPVPPNLTRARAGTRPPPPPSTQPVPPRPVAPPPVPDTQGPSFAPLFESDEQPESSSQDFAALHAPTPFPAFPVARPLLPEPMEPAPEPPVSAAAPVFEPTASASEPTASDSEPTASDHGPTAAPAVEPTASDSELTAASAVEPTSASAVEPPPKPAPPPEPPRAAEPTPEPELDVSVEEPVPAPAARAPAEEPAPVVVALSNSEEAKARRRSNLLSVSQKSQPTSAAEPDDLVLGIDLGTTNLRVAVFRNGAPSLLPVDREGRSFALPTLVALDERGELVVGEAARAQMLRDPSRAVFGAKRLLGRRARSPKVKELAGRFPFSIEPDENGDAGVRLGDAVHRLPVLYARLLSELKQAARQHLGREVTKAVLCVPAYFNDHQRAATREAGKLAGLDVVRLFNEPSSVALAFGYGKGLARKRVLVYDLGGGTFDATVVAITGDDLEVVATGGDNFLGGMDFDSKVAGELARLFENREQLRLDGSPITTQRLRERAEQVKIALSDEQVAPVFLPDIARREGTPLDLRTDFTREDVERVTFELVERTAQLTLSVLGSGNLRFQGLDDVLLVGGQSRAPLVRRRIQELAGKPVRTDVDATAAVALGAAILGHSLVESSRGKPGVRLSEVLSAPIGLGVRGGAMLCVLDRNTRLPAEKTIGIPLQGQERVAIAVYQGGSTRADENEYLGSLTTSADRSGELSLRFAVGADGTLDLSAVAPGGKRFGITLATQDASDEVRAQLLADAPLPGEPEPPPEAKGLLGGIKKLFGRR